MLKILPNSNKEEYDEITQAVKDNDGYCPCELSQTTDTKCPCKTFREQTVEGYCHCGRFYKQEVKE